MSDTVKIVYLGTLTVLVGGYLVFAYKLAKTA